MLSSAGGSSVRPITTAATARGLNSREPVARLASSAPRTRTTNPHVVRPGNLPLPIPPRATQISYVPSLTPVVLRSAVCTGTAPASQGTPAPSFVSNSLFNFPAIATSFSNQGACSHAWSACSHNYDVCTSGLASGTGGFHVTIDVPGGGGTTVEPTHPTIPLASATSVCSSLSSQACYNLQPSVCSQTGTEGSFYVGTAPDNAQPRRTSPPRLAGIMAGVGIGFLGAQF